MHTEINIAKLKRPLAIVGKIVRKVANYKLSLLIISTLIFAGILLGILSLSRQTIAPTDTPKWLVSLVLAFISLSLHEVGHAIAMAVVNSPVTRIGIRFFLGAPVFFVDTTPVWSKNRQSRILTAAGGVIMNLIVIAVCGYLQLSAEFSHLWVLQLTIAINIYQIVLSLLPVIRMDGYYILIDLIGEPNLEQKAHQEAVRIIKSTNPLKKISKLRSYYAAYYLVWIVTGILFLGYNLLFWVYLFN